jgi:hypothetical protein
MELEANNIAKEVIYIKNRNKTIKKSSEFFLNYGQRYWARYKLILKHGVTTSNKNIREALTYIKACSR